MSITQMINKLTSSFDANCIEDWMQVFLLQFAIMNDENNECSQELKEQFS